MPSFWQDIDDDLCMDVVPCSDTHSFTTDLTEERQYESDAESFASSFAPLPSFIISTQFSTFNSPTLDSALLPWDSRHPPPFQQPPFNNPSTFTTPGRVFRSREVEDAFLSDIGSLGMMVPKGMADRLKLRDGVGGPIYIPSDFTASDGNVDSGSPEGWRPRSVLGTDSVDPIVFGAEDEMDVDDDEDMAEEEDERVEDIHVVIDESMAEDEPMLDSAVELNDEVIVPEQDKQVLIKTEELPVQVMESIEEPREPKLFPCPCGQTFERLCASGHERRPDGWFAGDSKQSVKAGVSERSFICDECPRTFLRRQDLRRHLVAQHGAGGGDGKKVLLCVGCKGSFSRSDALHRHIKAGRCKTGRV